MAVGEARTILESSDGTNWTPRGTGLYRVREYDLDLMAFEDPSEIPDEGAGLVVVAAPESEFILHFRIFDTDGNMIVDKTEFDLPEKSSEIRALKDELFAVWFEESLTEEERVALVQTIAFLTGISQSLNSVAWGGGTYVAVGARGTVAYSANGKIWKTGSLGVDENLETVVYANDLFLAAGDDGTAFTSGDGIFWRERETGTERNLLAATAGAEMYWTGGDRGALYWSAFEPGQTFAAWQQEAGFSADDLADPEISVPEADPENTGIPNLLRYAFGLDPREPEAEKLPQLAAGALNPTEGALALQFRRLKEPNDLRWVIETSGDLQEWAPFDAVPGVAQEELDTAETVLTPLPELPDGAGAGKFFRVRVIFEDLSEP